MPLTPTTHGGNGATSHGCGNTCSFRHRGAVGMRPCCPSVVRPLVHYHIGMFERKKRMQHVHMLRKLGVLLLALGLFAVSTVPTTARTGAIAPPRTTAATTLMGVEAIQIETEYYSDSSRTVLVGGETVLCNGIKYRWGQKTAYYIRYYESCG